jgi:hypothetical protein
VAAPRGALAAVDDHARSSAGFCNAAVETVVVAASGASIDDIQSLGYWLEDVPKTLFGGFDPKATRRLVAKLDASFRELVIQREKLLADLEQVQMLNGELVERERRLVAEVERLTGEAAASEQERRSFERQLECARTRWDKELARAKSDLEAELEHARSELTDYRRREFLLAEVVRTTRSRAESVTREARDEAERMLRKARRREVAITRDAERKLERLESERRRVQKLAAEFRRDMAERLLATLDQLNRREPGESRGEAVSSDSISITEDLDDR